MTSLFYLLHAALFEKKTTIVIVSATEDMAKKFLRRIRTELEVNAKLMWLFGPQQTDKWSETELRLQNGAVIHAKGRGAQLRGLIERARRPDLIILDDIEDEELVRSELRRLDLEQWFNGTVLPSMEPSIGQVIVVGTILHEDSLLARLLDKKLYSDFVQKKYSAIENDKALWEERFPLTRLLEMKAAHIKRGQLPQFYMEYMNDPMPQESATFRTSYFQFFDDLPQSKMLRCEMYVDLGGGSVKATADYTAIAVLVVDEHNTIFINDYVNVKMGVDTDLIIKTLFELFGKHKPSVVKIEKTMATNMIQAALTDAMIRLNVHMNVEYFNPPRGSGGGRRGNMSDAKYQRIAALEAPFKLGVIKIRPWMTDLIEQLLAFPRGRHDDLIDAVAYGYHFIQRRVQIAAEEEEIEEEYEMLYPELGL